MDWPIFDRGVFLVNVLAVVYDPKRKKVIIGRRENDLFIKRLTWSLPGGRPGYRKSIEHYLKIEIMKKTGLRVEVKKVIFSRTVPSKNMFLNIYYYCEPIDGDPKPGDKFLELKWVDPKQIKKYFKFPPPDPRLLKFLEGLG